MFFPINLYIIDLGFMIQFLLLLVEFCHIISQFALSQPVRCAARPISYSFCPISFNHTVFQFLINPWSLNSSKSQLLNRCMFINNWKMQFHVFIKCSVWMLLINHIRPTTIFNIPNIRVTAKSNV